MPEVIKQAGLSYDALGPVLSPNVQLYHEPGLARLLRLVAVSARNGGLKRPWRTEGHLYVSPPDGIIRRSREWVFYHELGLGQSLRNRP